MELGYLVDLSSVALDEGSEVTWIQALPLGTFQHPVYKEIAITPERVSRLADNVKSNVRGQDLDIDYDHKIRSGEAAGWIKDADARADGLWIAVEWTKDAFEKVKNKAYRYFSPEFTDSWTHPATKKKYQDVLFGGALTNRPFLKGILPINLSEAFQNNEGGNVNELRKLLGLPDDASDEEVLAAVQKIKSETPEGEPNPGEGQPPQPEPAQPPAPEVPPAPGTNPDSRPETETDPNAKVPVAASELLKLAEDNPAVKTLMERVNTLEAATRLSEVNLQLSEISNGKHVVPPTILDELRSVAVAAPKELSDKVIGIVSKLAETGLVETGERGGKTPGLNEQASKVFSDKVDALTKDGKVSYPDAVETIAASEPELFAAYRREALAHEEV